MHPTLRIVLALAVATFTCRLALAGPPAICWPIEIGDAETLTWGEGPFAAPTDVSPKALMRSALDALDDDARPLVRMETIRRAVIALGDHPTVGQDMLTALMARAMDAEADDEAHAPALAWFDAAYFVACCDQFGQGPHGIEQLGVEHGIAGYGWLVHASTLEGWNGECELAGAIMTSVNNDDRHFHNHAKAVNRAMPDGDELFRTNVERIMGDLDRIKGWRSR